MYIFRLITAQTWRLGARVWVGTKVGKIGSRSSVHVDSQGKQPQRRASRVPVPMCIHSYSILSFSCLRISLVFTYFVYLLLLQVQVLYRYMYVCIVVCVIVCKVR